MRSVDYLNKIKILNEKLNFALSQAENAGIDLANQQNYYKAINEFLQIGDIKSAQISKDYYEICNKINRRVLVLKNQLNSAVYDYLKSVDIAEKLEIEDKYYDSYLKTGSFCGNVIAMGLEFGELEKIKRVLTSNNSKESKFFIVEFNKNDQRFFDKFKKSGINASAMLRVLDKCITTKILAQIVKQNPELLKEQVSSEKVAQCLLAMQRNDFEFVKENFYMFYSQTNLLGLKGVKPDLALFITDLDKDSFKVINDILLSDIFNVKLFTNYNSLPCYVNSCGKFLNEGKHYFDISYVFGEGKDERSRDV